MGNKKDLPRVQYAVLRLGKGRARDLHLLRPRLDAGAAFEIAADRAPRIEGLLPTPPLDAKVEIPEQHARRFVAWDHKNRAAARGDWPP